MLVRGRWAVLWHRLDGAFLSTLLAGILTAIFSMASLIHWLLEAHPQPLGHFFGFDSISGMFLLRDEVVPGSIGFWFLRWAWVWQWALR